MRFKSRYQPSMDVPFVYLAVLGLAVVALLVQVLSGSPAPGLHPTPTTLLVVAPAVALAVVAVVVALRWRGRGGEDEDEDRGTGRAPASRPDPEGGWTMASLHEKLGVAVNTLASGSRSIQERVADAWISALCRLEANDFPPELRDAFQALRREATRHGNFEETAAKMAVDEARGHADRIVALYTHLLEKY
jgi:hypothetical protein